MKMDSYYLTLFKTDGHKRWRAHLCGREDGFKKEVVGKQGAKITEMKTIRVSRETAELEIKP